MSAPKKILYVISAIITGLGAALSSFFVLTFIRFAVIANTPQGSWWRTPAGENFAGFVSYLVPVPIFLIISFIVAINLIRDKETPKGY